MHTINYMIILFHAFYIFSAIHEITANQDRIELIQSQAFVLNLEKHETPGYSDWNSSRVFVTLSGKAELPEWMFLYQDLQNGHTFLYGTSPAAQNVDLDVIILSKSYEATKETLKLKFTNKKKFADHEVHIRLMDIELNDFYNKEKELLSIFQDQIWKNGTAYFTAISRPQDVGARIPLNPAEKEGLMISIGNSIEFSKTLKSLERELSPIQNRVPCPSRHKASSVEFIFRQKKLKVDWCSFKLEKIIKKEPTPLTYTVNDELETFFMKNYKEIDFEIIKYKSLLIQYVAMPIAIALIHIGTIFYLMHSGKENFYIHQSDATAI